MNLEIANRLQKLRKEKGYSQEELAQELGISRQAISKWERAEASPDTDNLICLAKLYNVSLDYLLSNDDSIETIKTEQMVEEKGVKFKYHAPKWVGVINGCIPLIITILYIVLGCIWNLWHPGWIVFLFIPILFSVVEVIHKKRLGEFLYPVFITAVYLFLGCVYSLWHPWWILFITIPIFYSLTGLFDKKSNPEDEEDEENEE